MKMCTAWTGNYLNKTECQNANSSIQNQKNEISKETKSRLFNERNRMFVEICKDGKVRNTVSIMPEIKNVRVSKNDKTTIVFVYFSDETFEKAVLHSEDTYSLEQGISICITKRLLCEMGVDGTSVYNKIIHKALKVMKNNEKMAEKTRLEEEKLAHKIKKIKAKKEARIKMLKEKEKERQIEIQKEAYLRAMRESKSIKKKI